MISFKRLLAIPLLLVLPTACDSSSDDEDEDFTPLREGEEVGSGILSAFDGEPSLSFDGSGLVYISGRLRGGAESALTTLQGFYIDLSSEGKKPVALTDGSHGDERAVAISPAGDLFAVAAFDGTAAAGKTGTLLLGKTTEPGNVVILGGPFARVDSLAFSSDGLALAAGVVDGADTRSLVVFQLPDGAAELEAIAPAATIDLQGEPPVEFLKFAPVLNGGAHELFFFRGRELSRCTLNTSLDACDPQLLHEARLGLEARGVAVLDDRVLFFDGVNQTEETEYFEPVIETGHPNEQDLLKGIGVRRKLFSLPFGGGETDAADAGPFGFDGRILAAGSGLQAGLFLEAYYCTADGATLKYASSLKLLSDEETAVAARKLPVLTGDAYSVTDDLCLSGGDVKVIRSGITALALNQGATPGDFTAVVQSRHTGDDELFLLADDDTFTPLAPNPD